MTFSKVAGFAANAYVFSGRCAVLPALKLHSLIIQEDCKVNCDATKYRTQQQAADVTSC